MKLEKFRPMVLVLALGLSVTAVDLAHGQVGRSEGLANPDMASEKELLALPHMNAALVKEIMARRPFLRMAELYRLLSDKLKKEQLAELYAKIFVQINLNNASDEEILLIPARETACSANSKNIGPIKTSGNFARKSAST